MSIKIKKNYLKIANLLVITILVLIWILTSVVMINLISFSVVTYQTKNNINKTYNSFYSLNSENIFKGEFKARDDYLGLIYFEVEGYKKEELNNKDLVIFKFKEKGRGDWEFQQEYDLELFDSQSQFTFGLPVVTDSKNKNYEFELSATSNNERNHVKLKTSDSFVTGYKYSKSEILGGSKTAKFFYSKIIGSFSDVSFVKQSLIYIVPFVLILITILLIERMPYKNILNRKFYKNIDKKHLKIIFLVTLVIFFPKYFYINIEILFAAFWIAVAIIYDLKSKYTFIFSFILLFLWIFTLSLDLSGFHDKLNVLVFILLVFGVLQLIIEEKRK